MDDARSILAAMRAAAPQGLDVLEPGQVEALRGLTARLIAARPGAVDEYRRFQSVYERAVTLPGTEAQDWLADRTVVVTGGTGCIGSMLLEQLTALRTREIVSVTRGVTRPWRAVPGVRYVEADVRDRARLEAVLDEVRPDAVFHVAAQRSPGLAEIEVHRTVTTNILGTRNLLDLAVERGIPDIVVTSTGKALRPYSQDVYAASKRVAEWLTARSAARGTSRITAARFTHVVDNSIVVQRLRDWCKNGVIRLHSTEIDFYIQSATESAQLLIAAGLGGRPGVVRMHALRDLDWPVNLLEMTLGMLADTRSDSPIYVAGYEDGYEQTPFPALYDPRTAGGISPLINAFEAANTAPGRCEQVDAFDVPAPSDDADAVAYLGKLEKLCANTDDADALREPFDELCRAVLEAFVRDQPKPLLTRAVELTEQYGGGLNETHHVLLDALKRWSV